MKNLTNLQRYRFRQVGEIVIFIGLVILTYFILR